MKDPLQIEDMIDRKIAYLAGDIKKLKSRGSNTTRAELQHQHLLEIRDYLKTLKAENRKLENKYRKIKQIINA